MLPWELVEIEVAAGDDEAHTPPGEPLAMRQEHGKGHSAGGLDDDLQVAPDELHRLDDGGLHPR